MIASRRSRSVTKHPATGSGCSRVMMLMRSGHDLQSGRRLTATKPLGSALGAERMDSVAGMHPSRRGIDKNRDGGRGHGPSAPKSSTQVDESLRAACNSVKDKD